ncbi:hypothetical protein SAMN02949497_3067 [Methylomagnum ishizawai]|uniref:Uncharacterized protein n=1 Tax=Methylomagnum ishizawai TaxID=1760988 RepID=A0A1Y6D4C0_9GAMM|nr:hypothetical protein [Methylomagnum ishizawai]SMF95693.1 hypothetical protein SAMN02949497_3067 [Methylomagnum ishizawai]
MNRRRFLQASALTPVVLLPNTSEAFLGLLLRFLLRGVLSRGAARAATGAIARAGAGTIARAGVGAAARAVSVRSLASFVVQTGAISAVSLEVANLVKEFNAQAIFVRDAENVVTVQGNQTFNLNLSYIIEDVVNGTKALERKFYAASTRDFKFDFKIKDLPFTGVGRLHGIIDTSSGARFSSPNFVIAEADQVSYDDPT